MTVTKKKMSAIARIDLDSATFENTGTSVEPSYVNYFFGKNGAGKSTIAKSIGSGSGVVWRDGESRSKYDVLVFNREFIEKNFSSYGDLPGVITVHEQNIETQRLLTEKKNQKAAVESRGTELSKEKEDKAAAKEEAAARFRKACWDRTSALRETLKEAFKGKLKAVLFAGEIMKIDSPRDHSREELEQLYNTAFSADSRSYRFFEKIGSASAYGKLPGNELLDKAVVSGSDTSFARFIKALNATDWVRQGHTRYADHASGKCPYCQQRLPDGFEQEIAACFDAQYRRDIDDLREFETAYKRDTAAILEKLRNNLQDVMPTADITEYKDKLSLLESKITINCRRAESKLKEPSSIVALEDTDSVLISLGHIIDDINRQIEENNNIVSDRRKKQEQCRREAWELAAFILHDEIKAYEAETAALDSDISAIDQELSGLRRDYRRVSEEIKELNKQSVNTEEAIDSINSLLRSSGFQGFELRPKRGVKDTYEVVRPNGEIASALSEGEKNFIAFLYFYRLVKGNGRADGISAASESADARDKIVVIDDPVSGMDSSALLIVSSIVREMTKICRNKTEHGISGSDESNIKQIFILTHNAYFYNEIAYRDIPCYDSASFFLIWKSENRSSAVLCVRQNAATGETENYCPVRTSYAALWDELKRLYNEENSVIAVKNVSRIILERYFISICGFSGDDMRSIVLEANKQLFDSVTDFDGQNNENRSFALASELLNRIGDAPDAAAETFIDSGYASEVCKDVFKLIFYAMGHERHYNMMMYG